MQDSLKIDTQDKDGRANVMLITAPVSAVVASTLFCSRRAGRSGSQLRRSIRPKTIAHSTETRAASTVGTVQPWPPNSVKL